MRRRRLRLRARHESAPKRKVVAKHERRQAKRQHPKPKPAPTPRATLVVQPERPARSKVLGPSLAQLAASQTISLPIALEFFLALMIGLSVLVAALAVAPRRAVPRPLLGAVGGLERRELLFVAIGLDAAAGFLLLMYVLAGS